MKDITVTGDVEETRITFLVFILRDKRSIGTSLNLILRASEYYNLRTHTSPPIHKIKTNERERKIYKMVRIPNIPYDHDIFSMNPDSYSDIYLRTGIEG